VLFWLLLATLLLVCLVALGVTLLTLWRRVKALGRQVSGVGSTVSQAQAEIDAANATGPLGAPPCPTCGAPATFARKKPAVLARDR
jgi:hypothetical protein